MRLICLLVILFAQITPWAQESEISFGTIKMQIDSGEAETYAIKSAVLYQNAAVSFDTLVQVQNGMNNEILYYPQILEGKENILRLILAQNEDNFYDAIFNLGDSLEDVITYEAADSKIFLNYEGRLNNFEKHTRNANGQILISRSETKEEQISGELNTSFEVPLDKDATRISTIALEGTFEVYFGEFRSVSLATGTPLQENKKKYVNNLVVAMMLAAVGLFVFLVR